MCGICGALHYQTADSPPTDEATITRLSALMAWRGPDDAGRWHDGDRAWLAFRRLAILDCRPPATSRC